MDVADLVYNENEIFLRKYGSYEIQVFSEKGTFLRSWIVQDESKKPEYPRSFCVEKKYVFLAISRAILIFNRLGNYLFNLTMPYFLIPNGGFSNMCIQNHKLYVSSKENYWIYIFELKKKIYKERSNVETIKV